MHNDFDKIETELRQIEEDFETGRMNAFGSKASQDAFIRELRRIADIESQVFYRTCTILKEGGRNEHAVMTNMFASAEAPGQGGSTGNNANNTGNNSAGTMGEGMDGSLRFRNRGGSIDDRSGALGGANSDGSGLPLLRRPGLDAQGRPMLPRPLGNVTNGGTANFLSAVRRDSGPSGNPSMSLDGATSGYGAGGTAGASATNTASNFSIGAGGAGTAVDQAGVAAAGGALLDQWGNEAGYADSAFDDVIGHFALLESEFETVGENLRQISKHVMRLNDMSDQVNSMNPTNSAELNALRREAMSGRAASRSRRRTAEGTAAESAAPSATNRATDSVAS